MRLQRCLQILDALLRFETTGSQMMAAAGRPNSSRRAVPYVELLTCLRNLESVKLVELLQSAVEKHQGPGGFVCGRQRRWREKQRRAVTK